MLTPRSKLAKQGMRDIESNHSRPAPLSLLDLRRSIRLFVCLLGVGVAPAAWAQCSGNVCTSSGGITITSGTPSSYPWTIAVSGLTGSVSKVTLTLHTLNDTNNF